MTQARRYLWDYSDEIFNTKLNIAKKISQSFELEFGVALETEPKPNSTFLGEMIFLMSLLDLSLLC